MSDVLIRASSFVAVILLGFFLRRIGLFKQSDFSVLSKVVLKITFPAAVISSFAGRQIDLSMLSLIVLSIACGLVYMAVSVILHHRAPKEQRAFVLLNLSGYNIGNFTMPFVQSFLGPIGVITTGIFDIGNAVITLGGAFGVASSIHSGAKFSVKRIVKALLSSVPFVTYCLMLILSVANIQLPAVLTELVGVIGNANPFMAMFMIGVGFQLGGEKEQIGKIIRLLLIRYGIATALALLCWFVLPFSLEIRQVLVILVFSPIPSIVPAYTEELHGDVGLSSAFNSVAILVSIVIDVVLLSVMV